MTYTKSCTCSGRLQSISSSCRTREAQHLHHTLSMYRHTLQVIDVYTNQEALVATNILLAIYSCTALDFSPSVSNPEHDSFLVHSRGLVHVTAAHPKATYRVSSPHFMPKGYISVMPTEGRLKTITNHLTDLYSHSQNFAIYMERIDSLTDLIEFAASQDNRTREQVGDQLMLLFKWAVLIPDAFHELLTACDPVALIILAHYYAAILCISKLPGGWWFWQEKPAYMIATISQFLGSEWDRWMKWPSEILETQEQKYGIPSQDLTPIGVAQLIEHRRKQSQYLVPVCVAPLIEFRR
jgi:hypothetical protein